MHMCARMGIYKCVYPHIRHTYTHPCVHISHLEKVGTKLYVLIIKMRSQTYFTYLFSCFSHETVAEQFVFDYQYLGVVGFDRNKSA